MVGRAGALSHRSAAVYAVRALDSWTSA